MILRPRTRTVLAWMLWLGTMASCLAGLVVALLVARPLTAQVVLDGALFAIAPVGYATVGLVLTLRRPANPIGWLHAASAIALGITLPALLVPDGRLRSRRWRMVAVTAVAGPAMFVTGVFLIPGPTSDTPVPFDNPFGQPGLPGQLAKGIAAAGLALHVASLLAALLCVILRFRASRGVERQQLRWVATGAAITVLGVTVPLGDLRGAWVDPVVILCVPWPSRWRCCATGSGTWTAWSAGPSPTPWSPPCWSSPTC
jgi:hypothetical protein